jgi:HlyD family secretion protein
LDLARRTLGRVQVRSAFGGVVTRVWRGPGAIVDGTAATPIAQVLAASGAEFVADATEQDLLRIRVGQAAEVRLGLDEVSLKAVVRAVASALEPTTGLGNARISLEESPQMLPFGAHGRALIVTRHRENVALLPFLALRGAVADGAEVVVCAGASARVQQVAVGYRDQRQFEVVSGLADGEKVAVDHVLGLDTGTALVEAP